LHSAGNINVDMICDLRFESVRSRLNPIFSDGQGRNLISTFRIGHDFTFKTDCVRTYDYFCSAKYGPILVSDFSPDCSG
jgi:hypothetical protein